MKIIESLKKVFARFMSSSSEEAPKAVLQEPSNLVARYEASANGMSSSIYAHDVYNTVAKHDYGAVPRGATAEQGIAFLNSPRFHDGEINLVKTDPLRAMDLAVAVGEKVTEGAERTKYMAVLESHPVVPALAAYAPKAAAHYADAREKLASGAGQDPDRAAWQAERRAYLNAKDGVSDDTRLLLAHQLLQNQNLAALSIKNPYSSVDAKLAVIDTVSDPKGQNILLREHVLGADDMSALRADAPKTAVDMVAHFPIRFAPKPQVDANKGAVLAP
jgi:hypothetical protein